MPRRRNVAQLDRALGSEPEGCGFESRRSGQGDLLGVRETQFLMIDEGPNGADTIRHKQWPDWAKVRAARGMR